MPEAVIFTVDFFNALYLVSCMQSASSVMTVLVIKAVDFTQTAIQPHGLHRRTSRILRRLHQVAGLTNNSDGVLHLIVLLCSSTVKFDQQARSSIQIRSCLYHSLSSLARSLLDHLAGRPKGNRPPSISDIPRLQLSPCRTTLPAKSLDWKIVCRVTAVIHPVAVATIEPGRQKRDEEIRAAILAVPAHNRPTLDTEILHESLEMLFTTECIFLTEYFESIIPLIYASFVLMMVHRPSAKYHTELAGVTTENVSSTVTSVLVYALLELESFVVLAGLLR
ncbi:hypothetical protein PHYPSEUDO_012885 [Phytophthora pseudosyringae]|uniref:Uncharacterized protein n=1 Tax=Phytophthora pseudosyringae TaxID=221518 RepID=A0A8T1W3M5_9STRA|nr:hypothetical protein PHYPSEUDO_012885 [Phytophthora pseudosyringae]